MTPSELRPMENRELRPETPIISLWQPWAEWVALGWKTIETRTHQRFKGLVGKRIGIHVALKWDDSAIEVAGEYLGSVRRGMTAGFLRIGGAVICTAFVREHRKLGPLDNTRALIDCTHITRYGLILEDIQIIEAVPAKGKQGIWYLPERTK